MISAHAYQSDAHIVIRVRSDAVPQEGRSLHVAFAVDCSGSMEGDRMESVKRTLHAARDLFQPQDFVTIVAFGNSSRTVTLHQAMDEAGAAECYRAIDDIQINGSTNLSSAFEALASFGYSYDAIIILTDGHINMGLSSTAGLRAMGLGIGRGRPLYTIGYGSDHNRILLRDMALHSRGSYTYIDSEDILPVTMGDILSGLRMEVAQNVTVTCEGKCMELGAEPDSSSYCIGNIIPDRNYWVVFSAQEGSTSMAECSVTGAGLSEPFRISAEATNDDMKSEVREQILRCRIVHEMAGVTDALEKHMVPSSEQKDVLQAMKDEIAASDDSFRLRPLVLRMTGQIEDILQQMEDFRPSVNYDDADLGFHMNIGVRRQRNIADTLARLSSGTAVLATQRGVFSQSPPDDSDPTNHEGVVRDPSALFSSPVQRTVSNNVRSHYFSHPRRM